MKEKNVFEELTILYVEDEVDIVEEIELFLEMRFKEVYTALDGEQGLQLFKEHNPDMVLTDITMPKKDGLEMSKEIKQIDSGVPIILMTALNDSASLSKAINIGIDGYITKPVEHGKMMETLRKTAETMLLKKRLAEKEKLLSEYGEAVDAGALVSKTDINGIITYVNDEFCKVSGYSREELIGQSHNIVRHPDESAEVYKEMWGTIRAKKIWKGNIKNLGKGGRVYHVAATIVPILDKDEEITEFLALRQDITELEEYRSILEAQLSHSTYSLGEKMLLVRQFEQAIEESNAMTKTDLEGRITFANEQFCKLSGYAESELIGHAHSIVRHPEMAEGFFKQMWETITRQDIWHGIIRNRAKNGDSFYLDTTIVPLVDLEGNTMEYMSIRHDVTELIFLNKEIEETQREVIATMGAIGETRSKETGFHVKRVAEYSKILALKVGLGEEEAELIKMASPMHDIGKVGIPDAILNKPGKLTVEEFEHMKQHAVLGYEMLKASKRKTLQAASIVALEHHEKWDGSGYPAGKKGEDIHIYGRITAIADVFDALGSDRVYKKGWELEKILEFFKEQSGTHFDPNLVDLFFANLDEFLEIRETLKDV